ncbi:MAG TPA: pyridoxamine 5'-phosphate oxidase family protein [Candidatus Krumholzibacteria bacterium]|nr:pyridoxamine 5'-phosphate oxidase family protein [Candidatus Krumholzibacteria bacterium]
MSNHKPTDRTRVRRIPKRGVYDRATIDAILDEGIVCHVGFVVDGQPFVIPTLYGRDGDRVILHGSAASRMLETLDGGVDICLTVTLTDAIVVARSAFHSSMNYRSVMLLGRAHAITEPAARMEALRVLVEHVIPQRWDDCRLPNDAEMKATLVLAMPIDEASAKIRTGPPLDEAEDFTTHYWSGLLPLHTHTGTPLDDPTLTPGIDVPTYIRNYTRKK